MKLSFSRDASTVAELAREPGEGTRFKKQAAGRDGAERAVQWICANDPQANAPLPG